MTIRSYQYQVQVLVTSSSSSTINKTVTDALGLTDEAFTDAKFVSVGDTINFQEFAGAVLLFGGVSPFSDDLGLTDTAKAFGYETVVDTIAMTDEVDGQGPINLSRQDSLFLEEDVEVRFFVRNLSVSDDLSMTDKVSLVLPIEVIDTIVMTDIAPWVAIDTIVMTDVAEWGYGVEVEDSFTLSETLDLIQNLNRGLSDSNILSEAVTYWVESRCGRYEYQQFHGSGGVPPQDLPLSYDSQFLIQSIDTGQVVQLRNPETDDRRRYAFDRVNRNLFDGTIDLFADPNWAVEQSQVYTIVANKREIIDTLWDFLQDNLGREVLIKDWRGQNWRVIITNPGEVYTEDGEGYWTIDFDVVGVRVDGEFGFDFIELTDELSRAGSIWTRSGTDTVVLSERVNQTYDLGVEDDASTMDDTATFTIV